MAANRTRSTSKTPGFNSVTLSSSANRVKPGKRLANSTTSRMAGRKRSEKSCSNCCWPLEGAGVGFNGQAYNEENNKPLGYTKSRNAIIWFPNSCAHPCRGLLSGCRKRFGLGGEMSGHFWNKQMAISLARKHSTRHVFDLGIMYSCLPVSFRFVIIHAKFRFCFSSISPQCDDGRKKR